MQSLAAVEHPPEEVVALIKKYVYVYQSIPSYLVQTGIQGTNNM